MMLLLVVGALLLLAAVYLAWTRHDSRRHGELRPRVPRLPDTWEPPEYDAEYESWIRGGGR